MGARRVVVLLALATVVLASAPPDAADAGTTISLPTSIDASGSIDAT
jgi:hypothetical protein